MPEGDTILRTARRLGAAMIGKEVRAATSTVGIDASTLVGRRVSAVEAHGKNLLIRFDDGRTLHSHMQMNGAWHIARPGERWQKPAFRARISLDVGDYVAICFDAPVVRLLRRGGEQRDDRLRKLGPDLLAEGFTPELVRHRLRALGDKPIGEALLVQSAIAGIGNIYKSETLFECRINPFVLVSALDDVTLDAIVVRAVKLMSRSLGAGARNVVPRVKGGRYWVYRRSGEPCRRCGHVVKMKRQGATARSTYWCPRCQACEVRDTRAGS